MFPTRTSRPTERSWKALCWCGPDRRYHVPLVLGLLAFPLPPRPPSKRKKVLLFSSYSMHACSDEMAVSTVWILPSMGFSAQIQIVFVAFLPIVAPLVSTIIDRPWKAEVSGKKHVIVHLFPGTCNDEDDDEDVDEYSAPCCRDP